MNFQRFTFFLLFSLVAIVAHAQVKVGSNPGTIDATSNLEVEATNGNKTRVNKATGQVTIQDGTQGAAKVLTSDANGGSSWQALPSGKLIVGILPDEQTSEVVLPNGSVTYLGGSITLTPGKWLIHASFLLRNPTADPTYNPNNLPLNLQVYLSTATRSLATLYTSITNPVAPGFLTGEVLLPGQNLHAYATPQVISVPTTTTYYIVAYNYTNGNQAFGTGLASISRNVSGTSCLYAQSLDF